MNDEDMRVVFAMFIINGMMGRFDPKEIDPENGWYLADEMVAAGKPKAGLPAIEKRKKKDD